MSYFRECPNCGDNLDPGEVCRCRDIKRAAPEPEPPKAADEKIPTPIMEAGKEIVNEKITIAVPEYPQL